MAKIAPPDLDRFKAYKSRILDYYEYNADSIREKKHVKATAMIFGEMGWLAHEVRRLGLDKIADADRFKRLEKALAVAIEDQEGAINSGQFVQVRSDWFAAYRFLVRCFEQCLQDVLEVEDQFAHRAKDTESRIVADLEDGVLDDEPIPKRRPTRPATVPARPVRVKRPEPVADDDAGSFSLTPGAGAVATADGDVPDDEVPGD